VSLTQQSFASLALDAPGSQPAAPPAGWAAHPPGASVHAALQRRARGVGPESTDDENVPPPPVVAPFLNASAPAATLTLERSNSGSPLVTPPSIQAAVKRGSSRLSDASLTVTGLARPVIGDSFATAPLVPQNNLPGAWSGLALPSWLKTRAGLAAAPTAAAPDATEDRLSDEALKYVLGAAEVAPTIAASDSGGADGERGGRSLDHLLQQLAAARAMQASAACGLDQITHRTDRGDGVVPLAPQSDAEVLTAAVDMDCLSPDARLAREVEKARRDARAVQERLEQLRP